MRTWKQTNRRKDTHSLEIVEGGACQDMERSRPSEGHSLPGNGRGRDLLGHRKEPTDQGALTSWRRQREGVVRSRKATNQARGTHELETGEEGTRQDTERNDQLRRTHKLETRTGRDLSEYRKKPTDQCALTNWRRGREVLVSTQKEANRPRCTHSLGTAEGGTCQDTERNQSTEAHSRTGDEVGGTCQDTERNRLTEAHSPTGDSRGTCHWQDTERNKPTEAHSHSGDDRGRDLSGHGKKLNN